MNVHTAAVERRSSAVNVRHHPSRLQPASAKPVSELEKRQRPGLRKSAVAIDPLARLTNVERRLNAFMMVIALLVVALFYWFNASPAASLETSPQRLVLVDEGGQARASLRLYSDTPVLALSDEQGVSRLLLGLRFDGSPLMELSDAQGRSRFRLTMDGDGRPELVLRDENGDATFTLR